MSPAHRAIALGILLTVGAVRGSLAGPALVLTPCEIEHPLRLSVLAAECGVLTVPENPQQPGGRQIGLHVARVAAVSRRKQPDPLFVLAGGPGAAAGAFYATVAGAFARIQRERDLEQVRAALGYERINLYGASYGTRVAQHYLRRFGARTRSVILDGVVPVSQPVGPSTALDAEAALEDILRRCANDPVCRERFGDPASDYRAVRAALKLSTVPISVRDPTTGEDRPFEFGADHLASVLRLLSYTSEYAALLPLVLHAAAAHEDYAPLAAQYLMVERAYAQTIAVGMHNSVVCAEDVPRFADHPIDRARLAATYLGTRQLDGLVSVCRAWPRGEVDADLHAPLTSAVPALLLSGSDDPATPPAFAHEASAAFTQQLEVVLEGFGHGQLTAPCVDRIMAQFVARASVEALDVSCTLAARPLPFFTSLNGPPP